MCIRDRHRRAGVAGPSVDGWVEPAGALRAPAVAGELAGLLAAAAGLVGSARAANTRTAYGSDWAWFAGWCAQRDLAALPATPATLGAYLTAAVTDPAGPTYVPATLARWVAAVNFTHRRRRPPRPRGAPAHRRAAGRDPPLPRPAAGAPGRAGHRRPAGDPGRHAEVRLARGGGRPPGRPAVNEAVSKGDLLSLIHISEPTRLLSISYAVF